MTQAMFVTVSATGNDHGVFWKVAPEDLQIGDRIAFNTYDVGYVTESVGLTGGLVEVHYVHREGHVGPELTRDKRRGTKTIALIERNGERVAEAPHGTPFDR